MKMKRALSVMAMLLLVALIAGACSDPQQEETGSSESSIQEPKSKDSVRGAPTTVARPAMRVQATEQRGSVLGRSPTPTPVMGPQATDQEESVSGRSEASTPVMDAQATKSLSPVFAGPTSPTPATATTEQGTQLQGKVKPEGYYHGVEHGLAVTQTARVPSNFRDGWVDITLNLAVVRFDGVGLSVKKSADAGSVCFVGETVGRDCFQVQWGSEEQFEADLSDEGSVIVERDGLVPILITRRL